MARILDDISQTVGHTPLIRLNRVTSGCCATVLAKLEFMNPLSSLKDRIGLTMIDAAMAEGRIGDDTVLIETTSGNTGIALAFVAAARGLRLVLTMPEGMSIERRALLHAFGAEVQLTPAAAGMQGAVDRAHQLALQMPNAVLLEQFENPANPDAHRDTTAVEIWEDTDGEVDAFVTGIGTGGTLTGVAQYLKARRPSCAMIAVEPATSAVLSGRRPGAHQIQGLGAGFIPKVLDVNLIDEVITVTNQQSFEMAREVARLEGIPAGISSGAALHAALAVARRPDWKGRTIVVVFADSAERYLSTPLFKDLVVS